LELKDKTEEIKKINEKEIVKEFDPISNLLIINLKDNKEKSYNIKIDFRKSTAQNAEKAYNESKKYKLKLKGAQQSIIKTKQLIKQTENNYNENLKKEKDIGKDKIFWFEKFRWFISSEDNIIIGGKDAKSNDQVVKKYLKKGDRYAHAEIQGAPSCVIKSKDIEDKKLPISKKTLEEACIFSACYSKAWKQFIESQAYWVLPEQVSKTPQSGEYIPKGAFIIRGKRNYCRCKLEVAVGPIQLDDNVKVMCGPVNAIRKHTDKYAVIVPGDTKKSDMAHILAKAFDVGVDSVDRVLPPGGITVIKTEGVSL